MPSILVTIDTDIGEVGRYFDDAFECFMERKAGDVETGFRYIMERRSVNDAVEEFFVDIFTPPKC